MDLDQKVRSRWEKAAGAAQEEAEAEQSAASRSRGSESPSSGSGDQLPAETDAGYTAVQDVPEAFREKVYNYVAQVDGLTRKGLGLPEREGVEVELEPGDTLRIGAELMAPWLWEQRDKVNPASMAVGGLALIVVDGLRDGGLELLLESGAEAPEDSEEYEPPPQGETADDF